MKPILVGLMFILLVLAGCARDLPGDALPTRAQDASDDTWPTQGGAQLAFTREGDVLVFGPFNTESGGIDYRWLPDGEQLLLLTSAAKGQEVWLIQAETGSSRLLREATTISWFPLAYPDEQTLLTSEWAPDGRAFQVVRTQWDATRVITTSLLRLDGIRVLRRAVSQDGRYVTIHYSDETGGHLVRLDTADNSVRWLREALPTWDGFFPVWFSPQGDRMVLPGVSRDHPELELLHMADGIAHSLGLGSTDFVAWNADGRFFAYKHADGTHQMDHQFCRPVVISRRIRVHDANDGKLVWELELPHQKSIGGLVWLDGLSLLVIESHSEKSTREAYWLGCLNSRQVRLAAAAEVLITQMPGVTPRVGSDRYQVNVRRHQSTGETPYEFVHISPKQSAQSACRVTADDPVTRVAVRWSRPEWKWRPDSQVHGNLPGFGGPDYRLGAMAPGPIVLEESLHQLARADWGWRAGPQ